MLHANRLFAAICGGVFGLALSRSLFEYAPSAFGLLRAFSGGVIAGIFFAVVAVTALHRLILNHPLLHAHRYSIFIPLLLPALILIEPTTDLTRNLILIIGAIGGVCAILTNTNVIARSALRDEANSNQTSLRGAPFATKQSQSITEIASQRTLAMTGWLSRGITPVIFIRRTDTLYIISLISVVSFIYLKTLAPTLGEADTFEMQVNAIRLGISHGSGYPLYLLLAKFFSLLPIGGTVAFRINLSSSVFGILASILVYLISRQLNTSRPASWIAALSFAASIAFWSRAVEAEVYTLHVALVGLILWIAISIQRSALSNKKFYLLSFLFGLSLTNHLTTTLLAPAILIALVSLIPFKHNNLLNYQLLITKQNLRSLLLITVYCSLFTLFGLSLYLYLPLRWPIVNNGEVMTWEMFKHFITGQEAQGALRLNAWYSDLSRYEIVFRKSLDQFGWVGVITALIGFVSLVRKNIFAALITLAAYSGFAFFALSFYVPDPDYSSFMLPAHFVQTVWMAMGISSIAYSVFRIPLIAKSDTQYAIRNTLYAICLLLPASLITTNLPLVDKSNDWHFDKLGRYILSQPLKQNAAILADSELIAPLYYLQIAENIRPDLNIVVLPNEETYRAQLDERLDKGQTVYLGRYLPRLSEGYFLNSVGHLVEVGTSPNVEGLAKFEKKFGNEIRLRGFKIDSPTVSADESIRITFDWQAIKPPTNNYRVALRLVDQNGNVRLTNTPSMPVRKMFPTTAWQPNNVVTDFYQFDLDPSLEPDTYTLQVRFVLPFSDKGLGDWVSLDSITVTPPTQPSTISHPFRARFDNGAWLMGYDAPSSVTPKSQIAIRLFWLLPQGLTQPFEIEVCLEKCVTTKIDPSKQPKDRIIETQTTLIAPALSGKHQARVGVAASQAECGWFASQSSRCDLAVITIEGQPLADSVINFQNQIALESLKIETPSATVGSTVIVTAQWRGLRQMKDDYTVFVHLIGPDGLLHGQVDTIAAQGTMQTSQWKLNQPIADRFEIRIPDDAPKGEYRLEVGWYLLATLDRLSVIDSRGDEIDDKFVMSGLVVK